jgi:hypothetical protein
MVLVVVLMLVATTIIPPFIFLEASLPLPKTKILSIHEKVVCREKQLNLNVDRKGADGKNSVIIVDTTLE